MSYNFTRKFTLLLYCLMGGILAAKGQTVIYVDGNVSAGTGLSWASPYKSLKAALEFANSTPSVTTIYVAKGEYKPTTNTVRDSAFVIRRGGLKIYGGYASGGGARNTSLYPSVMTGDIGVGNNSTDNSYHVLVIAGLPANADSVVIDGFTVRDGNASNTAAFTYNGQSVLQNGGAGCNQWGNAAGSKTVLRSCLFTNNAATAGGGVMFYKDSTATAVVQGCVFNANTATNGAAVCNTISHPYIINSVCYNNNGNSILVNQVSGYTNLVNCTFNSNTAATAVVTGDTIAMTNCVLWGDAGTEFTNGISYYFYSSNNIIQGRSVGQIFANAASPAGADGVLGTADDGLRLSPLCFGLDNGDGTYIPSGITTDITGAARIQGGSVDIGAYEGAGSTAACATPYTRLYVNAAVTTSGNGGSWNTAYKTLQEALAAAYSCAAVTEVWVAKGTYYPTAYPPGSTGGTTARDYAFGMRKGLAVYGGFAGGETVLAQRNTTTNPTTLSGDIGAAGVNTDNCYHVVVSSHDDSTTLLDGFTVTNGNANYDATQLTFNSFGQPITGGSGGGIFLMASNATIKNCTVSGNNGGGPDTDPTNNGGGGIYGTTENPFYWYANSTPPTCAPHI